MWHVSKKIINSRNPTLFTWICCCCCCVTLHKFKPDEIIAVVVIELYTHIPLEWVFIEIIVRNGEKLKPYVVHTNGEPNTLAYIECMAWVLYIQTAISISSSTIFKDTIRMHTQSHKRYKINWSAFRNKMRIASNQIVNEVERMFYVRLLCSCWCWCMCIEICGWCC